MPSHATKSVAPPRRSIAEPATRGPGSSFTAPTIPLSKVAPPISTGLPRPGTVPPPAATAPGHCRPSGARTPTGQIPTPLRSSTPLPPRQPVGAIPEPPAAVRPAFTAPVPPVPRHTGPIPAPAAAAPHHHDAQRRAPHQRTRLAEPEPARCRRFGHRLGDDGHRAGASHADLGPCHAVHPQPHARPHAGVQAHPGRGARASHPSRAPAGQCRRAGDPRRARRGRGRSPAPRRPGHGPARRQQRAGRRGKRQGGRGGGIGARTGRGTLR